MKIPPSKKICFLLTTLFFLFFMLIPPSIFSKPLPSTKKTKVPYKAKSHPKDESPKKSLTEQTPGGERFCDAQSAVLMDALTGQILYEQEPHLKIPPASFVKILTLYLIFDAIRAGQLKMDEMVTVSEKAWRTQGSKMFVKVGDRVKVEDLIKGIAIASGNDACVAIAEHLAGSEEVFVSKMNEKAKLLGLKESQFKNSHGMPDEDQYTTAMDMALLAKRYIEDHPESLSFHSQTEFEYNGIRQGNRNTLLQKNIGVDGLKTGHIGESGYHLLATAKRNGQRMIAVLMGCDRVRKRGPEAEKLLEYGFKNFSTVEAVKKGATFGPVRVKRGKVKEILLSAEEDGRVTVTKGKESLVSTTSQLPPFVMAPIQKGQAVGKVLIQNEGKGVKEINLLAISSVEKSLIPPWPILVGILLGLAIVIFFGVWWFRRPRPKSIR
ncbi:MAG: D-alanyl-D-alanine carboxypeptidase family protein [Thermodesulfobacteriota bacterium]